MTNTEIIVLVTVAGVVVLALAAIQKRRKANRDGPASDLEPDPLRSGVSYDATLDGQKYRYKYFSGTRSRPPDFKVSIECPSKGEFIVARETRRDVFFKRLGIAAEIQTGDIDFDRDFYIGTDSIAFTESFFAHRRSGSRFPDCLN